MKALSPYDAVPRVKTRFTTFAPESFDLEICPTRIPSDPPPYCRAV